VTLVLAYLIKCKGMDYHTAFSLVKSRRKIVKFYVIQIHPNDGFIQQLKSFEKSIKNRRVSQSPEKKYDEPNQRYQTPQQSRRAPSSYTTLRESMLHNQPKRDSFSLLKKPATIKEYNYNNE
jgi:hypothetical protein